MTKQTTIVVIGALRVKVVRIFRVYIVNQISYAQKKKVPLPLVIYNLEFHSSQFSALERLCDVFSVFSWVSFIFNNFILCTLLCTIRDLNDTGILDNQKSKLFNHIH